MQAERRENKFTEKLSMFMVSVAAFGAFFVLTDPVITISDTVKIGGEGFSADLKGAVVSLILIGGWSAVKEFWLGTSASSEKKTDMIANMVSPPAIAGTVTTTTEIQPTKEVI